MIRKNKMTYTAQIQNIKNLTEKSVSLRPDQKKSILQVLEQLSQKEDPVFLNTLKEKIQKVEEANYQYLKAGKRAYGAIQFAHTQVKYKKQKAQAREEEAQAQKTAESDTESLLNTL